VAPGLRPLARQPRDHNRTIGAAMSYPTGRFAARLSRPAALAVVAGCYVLAGIGAAVAAYPLRHLHPITVTLVADLVATAVVFALSMVLANSSLYDPYWSVAPPVVAIAWVAPASDAVRVRQVIVVALVVLWAVRLTANWAVGWHGFRQEDWRYVELREQTSGRLPWWSVSLGGIQLMPTLVVFAGMLSLWPALAAGRRGLNWLDGIALVVTAGSIAVEAVADLQLRRFAADPANRGRTVDSGLWRWSRHPNYLGEIGFWWGLWLFGLAARPSWWWTVIGPVVMVVLFEAASIPLMEQRSLRRRPDYAELMRRVPRLLPLPKRRYG
jgi:steroid 5-alpha reductase family enzyme